jgi:transposase
MTEIPWYTKLHKPIWKFKIKIDIKFKAKLCFNENHQRKKIDYYETFALVARIENVRLTITLALRMEMRIHHGDVLNAFLNSPLDTNIYMYMPQRFEQPDIVCKLNKRLYGFRQVSLLWYKQMHQCLLSLHFKQTEFDNCIYYSEEKVTFISFYVDDILVISKSQDIIDKIFKALHDKFKIKHMGVVKEYLGIEFHFDKQNKLHLS